MPDHCRKNFFRNKLILKTPPNLPPRRKKNLGQCTILGVQNFSDIPNFFETSNKFSRYHKISHKINTISHKINTISHKIDRIFPIFFYNKPILPDCGANIARLALFAQQTGGLAPPAPPPGTPMWVIVASS